MKEEPFRNVVANDMIDDQPLEEEIIPPLDAAPRIDLEQLAKFEQHLLRKLKSQVEGKSLEQQANAEMSDIANAEVTISFEQVFLMIGAALMVLSLPFMHYLLAIILTLFTITVALVAGLSSPEQPFSPMLNLTISLVGMLFFGLSAIYIHTTQGANNAFWLYQVLAFLFLFSTFFSARTYRKKDMEE